MIRTPFLRTLACAIAVAFSTSLLQAAEPKTNSSSNRTLGKIVSHDPRFDKIVGDAKMEILAEGFDWSEGPVWVPEKKSVLFSDIPPNRIMQWAAGQKRANIFIEPAGYTGDAPRGGEPGTNGLVLDHEGRLILCEHGDRRVSRIDNFRELSLDGLPHDGRKDVKKTTLADRYEGKRFNSPNDAVLKSNGDIYFTDPPYGLVKGWDDPARELDFCGVYRVTPEGEVTLLTKEMTRPNGIALSPDEKTLYVAQSDSAAAIWMAFPVKEDGTIGKGRVLFDATKWMLTKKGAPDGLKVDRDGNLFATGPGGVLVFAPDGTHLGTLETGEATANVAWGDDGSTLYITADMYLARIRLNTVGHGFGENTAKSTKSASTKPKVLFLCTGNSCRSQIAEGWARQTHGDAFEFYSAGLSPKGLNPNAVKVMKEAGIDISEHTSKDVTALADVKFDYVVTVCGHADENCPRFAGNAKIIHVGFDDPPELAKSARSEAEAIGHYRRVRDEIRDFITRLPGSLETKTASN